MGTASKWGGGYGHFVSIFLWLSRKSWLRSLARAISSVLHFKSSKRLPLFPLLTIALSQGAASGLGEIKGEVLQDAFDHSGLACYLLWVK